MDSDDSGRSGDLPWSLSRVTGCNLDPAKHWYVVTQSLCGVRPNAFANYDIFRRFPDEIRSVPPADLKPACKGSSFNTRQPNNLYVVSSFGLCAALLRQPKLRANGFVYSQKIIPVVDAVNRIALDCEPPNNLCSLGGKTVQSNEELKKCQSRIAELEHEKKELEKFNEFLISYLPPPLAASSPSGSSKESSSDSCNSSIIEETLKSPLAASSPCSSKDSKNSNTSSSSNSSNSSIIEETLKSDLGPTLKKRKVASECKKLSAELDGVLEKYHESLACILGNSFLYGEDKEKAKVSEIISEVVNLVMDAKGGKKGITELLLPDTYKQFLESIRVPDWVLLYFKLQAKLPDAAWQTLLNLTQLGRSKVSWTVQTALNHI